MQPRHGTQAIRVTSVTLLAFVCAFGIAHATAPETAAASGVDVRGTTTYTLMPAARIIRVSADLTLRNVTPDTSQFRYFYTGYGVGIHSEARSIKATRGGRTLRTTVTRARGYQVVNVQFGTSVFRGQSVTFRLQFDLPDGGARSKSSIRVGRAFAGFYGYAFGEDLANVRIVLPAGFKVTTREGERLSTAAGARGSTVLSARGIRQPNRWWVFIAADDAAALRQETFDVTIGSERKPVTVRAWPEDQQWLTIVRARLERGLPVMGQLVGLPWPVSGTLEVTEVFSPLLGGYAGVFYEPRSQIRITEEPNELVILHEASHAWFNGDLTPERWINEGLADEYAALTLGRLGSRAYAPENVSRRAPEAFPLNEWPVPRAVNDAQTEARERYGYNASWQVVRNLVREVGETRMRDVLRAAAGGEIAYVGEGDPEQIAGVGGADWRMFLDLLEERGGSRTAEAQFSEWIVSARDKTVLTQRASARDDYSELVEDGGTWRPPYAVRVLMARWDFAGASQRIDVASRVLERRDEIAELARSLEVKPTQKLEQTYESTTVDLATAQQLADEQRATLQLVDQARARVAPERPPLTWLGLFGDDPDAALAEARRDFERDDLPGARTAASHAVTLLEGAAERGAERARIGLGGLAAFVLGGLGFFVVARRRSGSRPVAATGSASAAAVGEPQPAIDPTAEKPDPEPQVAVGESPPAPGADPAAASKPPDTLPATFRRDEEGPG
jgi:hypothetical protein